MDGFQYFAVKFSLVLCLYKMLQERKSRHTCNQYSAYIQYIVVRFCVRIRSLQFICTLVTMQSIPHSSSVSFPPLWAPCLPWRCPHPPWSSTRLCPSWRGYSAELCSSRCHCCPPLLPSSWSRACSAGCSWTASASPRRRRGRGRRTKGPGSGLVPRPGTLWECCYSFHVI